MPDSSFSSDPIDPKMYLTYEDYLDALEVRRKFEEKSKAVGDVMKRSKTDEDLIGNMAAIGFTYFEDELCEREWCNKNKICLLTALESIQENYNEYFFSGVLSENDFLVSKKDVEAMLCGRGCKLPGNNLKVFKAIEFLLAVDTALCFDNIFNKSWQAISKKEAVKRFGRSLYLFVVSVVRNKPTESCRIELESNLATARIFDEKTSQKFLKKMKSL